jgi:hypothetical protein
MPATAIAPKSVIHRLGPPPSRRCSRRRPESKTGRWRRWIAALFFNS